MYQVKIILVINGEDLKLVSGIKSQGCAINHIACAQYNVTSKLTEMKSCYTLKWLHDNNNNNNKNSSNHKMMMFFSRYVVASAY